MDIVFYERNFTNKISFDTKTKFEVDRYSWNMKGGPEKAYLHVNAAADRWDLMKLLRCPVEIYGTGGRLNWFGYVNRVTIPSGASMIGRGLDAMYNSVDVYYDGTFLGASSNAVSVTEYGQKEKILSLSNAGTAEATQAQAVYLADHHLPSTEPQLSGGDTKIIIECYGWYQTLDWKYYKNTGTDNVEHTAQITAIEADCGQFISGVIVENTTGLTSTEERDGRNTGLYFINQLLDAGTNNTRPLLAYVDKNRYLHVYERSVVPLDNIPDYLYLDDGNLQTPLGQFVLPEYCVVAGWARVKSAPEALGNTIRPFYIERAEYNARTNTVTYWPADAFEQIRLAKWVAEIAGTDSSSRNYPGYISPGTGEALTVGAYILLTYDSNSDNTSILDRSGFDIPSGYLDTVEIPGAGLYLLHYTIKLLQNGTLTASGTPGQVAIALTYPDITGDPDFTWLIPDNVNPYSDEADVDIVRIFRAGAGGSAYAYFSAAFDVSIDDYFERLEIIRLGD